MIDKWREKAKNKIAIFNTHKKERNKMWSQYQKAQLQTIVIHNNEF